MAASVTAAVAKRQQLSGSLDHKVYTRRPIAAATWKSLVAASPEVDYLRQTKTGRVALSLG